MATGTLLAPPDITTRTDTPPTAPGFVATHLISMSINYDQLASTLEQVAAELRQAQDDDNDSDAPLLISVPKAAARSGLSQWAVRQFLKDGRLRGVSVGRAQLVSVASLDSLAV